MSHYTKSIYYNLMIMNQFKLIGQEAEETKIIHPQLKCSQSHSIINICVNKNCNLRALYCQQQECSQFKFHEDCEHITLKSLTKSIQKCCGIKMTLRREMSSIYDKLFKNLKVHFLSNQREEFPIGDLDEFQEQIINQIYFKNNHVEMNSAQARKLSEKIKASKFRMEQKLPLLIEKLKSEIKDLSDQIIERGTSTLKELQCSFAESLGKRPTKLKQSELLKQINQTNLSSLLHDRKQTLQVENSESSKLIKTDINHNFQLYEKVMRNYQKEIQNLKQQTQEHQSILLGLFEHNNLTKYGEVITLKQEEPKEQSSDQQNTEKKFSLQPSNFQHIFKVKNLYDQILVLQKKKILDFELLKTYESIADQLRVNKFFQESIYFYQKARQASAKLNQKGLTKRAYQIFWIASNYNQLQQYQKALLLFNQCLEIYERGNGKYKEQIASTLNNIAVIYYNMENYQLAIEYNRKAIQLQKNMNKSNSLNIITYTKNIALAYFELEEYQHAQMSLKQCLNKIAACGRNAIQEQCICYNKLAEVYITLDKFDLCLQYVLKYMQKMKESNSQQCILKGQYLDWLIKNMSEQWSYEERESADRILMTYVQVIEELRLQLSHELYE